MKKYVICISLISIVFNGCSQKKEKSNEKFYDLLYLLSQKAKIHKLQVNTVGILDDFLELEDKQLGKLIITKGGSLFFPNHIQEGNSYNVVISKQPKEQNCSIENSSGIALSTMKPIQINCTLNKYPINLNVSGLLEGNNSIIKNGSNTTTVSENRQYTIAELEYGTKYELSISSQPKGQNCSLSTTKGVLLDTIQIDLTCNKNQYTISGSIYSALGTLTITNETTKESTEGKYSYIFPSKIKHGESYSLKLSSTNSDDICTFDKTSNGVATENISISIDCKVCLKDFVQILTLENNQTDSAKKIRCSIKGTSMTAVTANPSSFFWYYTNYTGERGTNTGYTTIKPTATILLSDMKLTSSNIRIESNVASSTCFSYSYLVYLNASKQAIESINLGCRTSKITDSIIPSGTVYLHLTPGDWGASVLIQER